MSKITDAEWSVLQVLWEKGASQLGTIVEELKSVQQWSRTTVHTYLTRMEGKGLVAIDRNREPALYSASISREDCAKQERQSLLHKVYRGATGDLIEAFLTESSISSEEKARLKEMLDDMEV